MDGLRLRILQVRGIPIYLDLSWLLVFALLTTMLVGDFSYAVAHLAPGVPPWHIWVMALVTALGFFTCIVLHELGHAITGQAFGMRIRGITLFLFGGVAELEREPPSARSEFWMAIAGPLVSAVLVLVFWAGRSVGVENAWPVQVLLVLEFLRYVNLVVLIFNMVPAFPLDGGRVFRSALWAWTGDLRRSTRWASLAGQGFGWFLAILGVLQLFAGLTWNGLWLILIGWFLSNAARRAYEHVLVREVLGGEPVSKFMNREPITVPPDLDLRHLVEDYVYRHHRKAFPVTADGHVQGIVTAQALQNVPRDTWDRHTVAEVMQRNVQSISVTPDTDAITALTQMQRSGSTRLLVMDGEQLAGIVSLRDLIDYLDTRLSLEGGSARADW